MKKTLNSSIDDAEWLDFLQSFLSPSDHVESDLKLLFGPLKTNLGVTVVGQLGQSLDGRIATVTGQSKYINGQAGLKHLHRLRALVDGVIIGVGTALADDPLLTVRLVPGPQPARIVIDPSGKLSKTAKIWQNDGARRLVITRSDARPDLNGLILLAGNGHVRKDIGVYHWLSPSESARTEVIAYTEDHGDTIKESEAKLYDRTVRLQPFERDDPCRAFTDKSKRQT